MKKVLSFALSMILIVALVLTSMIFASASVIHTVMDIDTLKAALQNAVDGDTITVTGDIKDVGPLTITKDVTFNGSGSITFAGDGFNLIGANVTIESGNFSAPNDGDNNGNNLFELTNPAKEETTATESSDLTIKGGKFLGEIYTNTGYSMDDKHNLVINGGEFTQSHNYLLNLTQGKAQTEVNGGVFYGAKDASKDMIYIWDSNAILHLNAGEFYATSGSKSIVAFCNSNEVTIGKADGTGPKMVQSSGNYMMYFARSSNNTSRTILGGEFIQEKGGYILDFNTGVEGPFVIAGGTFTALETSASDIIRVNDSNLKNFTISGGTFNQYSEGKNIIIKNNGSLNITGGTFNMLNEETKSAVIYTGKDKINGAFYLDGTNVVINNKGKGSVIEHHSACIANISNLKYEAKGEETAPILNVDITSGNNVSSANKINISGCEFTSETTPIVLSGLPCDLILDNATKITSKSFAIENTNESNIELNNSIINSFKKIHLDNAVNGKLSMFVTLNSNSNYVFSYDRAFTKGDQTALTPYIEAVMANGTTQEIIPTSVVESTSGVMKTTVTFKTPEGIATAKNIRIGVQAKDVAVSASFDNWQLFLADKFEMATGENLIDSNKVYNTQELTAYDVGVDENVIMVEGSFDETTVILSSITGESYNFKEPHIMMFMGRNNAVTQEVAAPTEDDPDKTIKVFEEVQTATNAYLYQEIMVEAGKTYKVSANVKYAATGSGGLVPNEKFGIELSYKKSGNYVAAPAVKLPEDSTEYIETYLLTIPDDISPDTKNFKFSFYFGSMYVSGYLANISVVEVDAVTNAVIGEELIKNGDFSTGDRSYWIISGSYARATVTKYVENYFSKVKSYAKGMRYFENSDNYAGKYLVVNYKPNTKYEILYQLKTITYNPDHVPGLVIYRALYTDDKTDSSLTYLDHEDEANPDVSYEQLDNNRYRVVIKTDDNLRRHNFHTGDVRFQSHTDSAGYYGPVEIYELDENGNRVSGNIALNGDFALGMDGWENLDPFELSSVTYEQETGFLDDTTGPTSMVYIDGSTKNQNYSTTITVDASKNYWFSGFYINMNSVGITPRILYQSRKANGAYEVLETELKYNSVAYRFEMSVEIPEDAVVKNGKAILKVQMNNGNNGRAYFRELRFAEEGKFTNLIESMTGPSSFQEIPYDPSVFVFYYDDSSFDDGDWSGELAEYAATTGAVSGRVVNSKQESVAGITMMLTPGNNTVKTDENGNYSFTNLNPGNYELYLVEANGNKLLCYDVEVKAGILSNIPLITYLDASELIVEIPEDSDGDTTVEQTPYGALRGYYLDKDGNPIKGAKIYLKGLGFVETNAKGMFEFSKLPVGEYEVYTKLDDGTVHVFRKVEIEAYKGSLIKLVEPTTGGFNWLWVIIPSASVVLLAGAAFVTILIIKKKKTK